ncbi:hypothetical protein [Bacillus sp. (in: firmicutes)]|uniref:hypothetical protein n=1 Tax=Bacillus sp. TaxID=1409 RepID=UPI0029014338|nr:hypothetical protein [Bacillus sp. (in: firmicutes)]MDU2391867.1 hypothetical protein [Bacillus sp. (in: firmicutes)]
MNYVEVKIRKDEINKLIQYIEDYAMESKGSIVDNRTKEFYRVISKQIIFFKYILNAYPRTYFIKVIISDFLSLILNDMKLETRYYYLNQRSIIENYMRLILKDEQYVTHITKQSFLDLKQQNESNLSEKEYNKIVNEYKIACSYIHGGDFLREYLVSNFEECLESKTKISERQRKNQISQFIDLISILNKLFLVHNTEEIDSAFHRNKASLEYLMGKRYINKFYQIK